MRRKTLVSRSPGKNPVGYSPEEMPANPRTAGPDQDARGQEELERELVVKRERTRGKNPGKGPAKR